MNNSNSLTVPDANLSPYFERAVYIYPAKSTGRAAVWAREMHAASITETEGAID
jgi:hypothetical protein